MAYLSLGEWGGGGGEGGFIIHKNQQRKPLKNLHPVFYLRH